MNGMGKNFVLSDDGKSFVGCDKSYSGEIVIPEGVITIEEYAFKGCSLLTSIVIPSSVEVIQNCAFSHCQSLKVIIVSGENKNYMSIDGVLYNKETTTIIRYPAAKTGGFNIPNTVTKIENWAFDSCTDLDYIGIPSSVKNLGRSAFFGCSSLRSVVIPKSVKKISGLSFSYCTSLVSIIIPKSVVEIGQFMFSHCPSLKRIEWHNRHPKQISCLRFVEYGESTHASQRVTLGMYVFPKEIYESCILHVPVGSKWRYRCNPIFGVFKNIRTNIGF